MLQPVDLIEFFNTMPSPEPEPDHDLLFETTAFDFKTDEGTWHFAYSFRIREAFLALGPPGYEALKIVLQQATADIKTFPAPLKPRLIVESRGCRLIIRREPFKVEVTSRSPTVEGTITRWPFAGEPVSPGDTE